MTSKKIGFIGAGNISKSIMSGLIKAGVIQPSDIYATNRTEGKLTKLVNDLGIIALKSNEELVETCHFIFVAVKPQDLPETLEPLANLISEDRVLISPVAGVPIEQLNKRIRSNRWIRVMPSLTSEVLAGVTAIYEPAFATGSGAVGFVNEVIELFEAVGSVYECESEEQFDAFMVASSSGVGFVMELMLYWQEWLESHDFSKEDAKSIAVDTFLGAAKFADQQSLTMTDLINKVASKKGVTQAGLDSMRELEVERALRISFDKSVLRAEQLRRPDSK